MKKLLMVCAVAVVATGLWGASPARNKRTAAYKTRKAATVKNEKVAAWENGKRAETLKWFAENQFGVAPFGRPKDLKIGKDYVSFADGLFKIEITVALPEGASKRNPAPVFLYGDFGCSETPPHHKIVYGKIPTNAITARGYAYVTFNFNDICPNAHKRRGDYPRWADGIIAWHATGDPKNRNVVRTPTSWGSLSAWAWGFSRVMDWIETRPELDAKRVAAVGHSRGGKTALWAAAQDTRFAMGVSNNSGCGGAKLNNLEFDKSVEDIEDILRYYPNWFCLNYAKWIKRDKEITHDSDDLLRLIAPRLCYVASARADFRAGPGGEFESYSRARDLWRAYGRPDGIGYHLREGNHNILPYDWEKFMDFADEHMK